MYVIDPVAKIHLKVSSLHWPILNLFYVLFVQWSIYFLWFIFNCTLVQYQSAHSIKATFSSTESNCIFTQRCIFAQTESVKLKSRPKSCSFLSSLKLFWLTMTSLTENVNIVYYTPLYVNKQNESEIIPWRLLSYLFRQMSSRLHHFFKLLPFQEI